MFKKVLLLSSIALCIGAIDGISSQDQLKGLSMKEKLAILQKQKTEKLALEKTQAQSSLLGSQKPIRSTPTTQQIPTGVLKILLPYDSERVESQYGVDMVICLEFLSIFNTIDGRQKVFSVLELMKDERWKNIQTMAFKNDFNAIEIMNDENWISLSNELYQYQKNIGLMNDLLCAEKLFIEIESKSGAPSSVIAESLKSIDKINVNKFMKMSKGLIEFNGQWYMPKDEYLNLLKKYDDINEIIQNESKEISIIY